MIERRPYNQLGAGHYGWLNTHYHFSFSEYYDPARLHWGKLRVWNDDNIAPKSGFPTHPHADMEIITYVYQGAISHEDSMGNKGRTEAGDVQIMSAGQGVTHSEYNLEAETTLLFQIWLLPDRHGSQATWGSKVFPKAQREGQFSILASGYEKDSQALKIQTSGRVLAVSLLAGQTLSQPLQADRYYYLVAAKGRYTVNGQQIEAHDGVAIKQETRLTLNALEECEIVMVETE